MISGFDPKPGHMYFSDHQVTFKTHDVEKGPGQILVKLVQLIPTCQFSYSFDQLHHHLFISLMLYAAKFSFKFSSFLFVKIEIQSFSVWRTLKWVKSVMKDTGKHLAAKVTEASAGVPSEENGQCSGKSQKQEHSIVFCTSSRNFSMQQTSLYQTWPHRFLWQQVF